jgi:hypothetical protein
VLDIMPWKVSNTSTLSKLNFIVKIKLVALLSLPTKNDTPEFLLILKLPLLLFKVNKFGLWVLLPSTTFIISPVNLTD